MMAPSNFWQLNEARDDGVLGWQWHQLDHMQTICTLCHSIFTGQMLFLTPNQQCQRSEQYSKSQVETRVEENIAAFSGSFTERVEMP